MGGKSDYLENRILDYVLRDSGPVYAALFTENPTALDDTALGTEVTGFDYARVQINFALATGGSTANEDRVDFPIANGGDWGLVTAFAVYDALTIGNLLYWGDLTPPKNIIDGETASFAVDALVINED